MNGIRKVHVTVALIVVGFLVVCNANQFEKIENSLSNITPRLNEKQKVEAKAVKVDYKNALETMGKKREKTIKSLCTINLEKRKIGEDIIELDHDIELGFKKKVEQTRQTNPADYKAKYSNDTKRKSELKEEKKNNPKRKKLITEKEKIEKEVDTLTCQDKVEKIQEKYLFKKIDLDKSLRDLEIAKINSGLIVK